MLKTGILNPHLNSLLSRVRHTVTREPHVAIKKRVPDAIGLIRTGDATPYANLILISA